VGETYVCGPLAVTVAASHPVLKAKVCESLDLYTVAWPPPHTPMHIRIDTVESAAPSARGTFLTCARMRVDAVDAELYATCVSGVAIAASSDAQRWSITVPAATLNGVVPEDIEDLVGLALTTGWRRVGWVPIHAAAVVRDADCAILCAPSGGGKSTLTAALIRRGWRTLGDDKLLLRLGVGGQPELAALLHTFNLHPQTREWFPEVGDLERLPRYSAWTEKRKVRIEAIWPASAQSHARPTRLVQLVRNANAAAELQVSPMGGQDVLDILLRQTVIPTHRKTAAAVLASVVPTARSLTGIRVEIGGRIFHDPRALAELEAALA